MIASPEINPPSMSALSQALPAKWISDLVNGLFVPLFYTRDDQAGCASGKRRVLERPFR
jgi:hypothetical protein